jgi:hypothetical protein
MYLVVIISAIAQISCAYVTIPNKFTLVDRNSLKRQIMKSMIVDKEALDLLNTMNIKIDILSANIQRLQAALQILISHSDDEIPFIPEEEIEFDSVYNDDDHVIEKIPNLDDYDESNFDDRGVYKGGISKKRQNTVETENSIMFSPPKVSEIISVVPVTQGFGEISTALSKLNHSF